MIAYRFDSAGIYCGEIACQLDPLASKKAGKEVWLLPGHSTFAKPPKAKSGYNIVWNGNEWEYVEIPKPPEPHKPTPAEEKKKKIAQLDAQYEADKQEILNYYTEAMFAGDTNMQADLKSEMQEIEADYIKKREELEGAE